MKPELARQIVRSLEATPELLPFLPELLADLTELGGSPRVVLELLRPLGLPPESRVLDLGCGKGGVLLTLEEQLGFHGVGVDAFAPFLEEAQRAAVARCVATKCEFRCADLHTVLSECNDFDVAMMLALGSAIGNLNEIVHLLRGCVRSGGFMIIDGAFLASGTEGPVPSYEGYSHHKEAIRQLTVHGDKLLKEYIPPRDEVARVNESNTILIRRRAEELARKHPEAANLLQSYVRQQEQESHLALSSVVWAIWLLQRR
jgi:SAM-dependent methyltransferase